MKAVILAGGFGTRLSEETHLRPKPMIEIGGRPILWHILKIYSAHGIDEFVRVDELTTSAKALALAVLDWCGTED